MEISDIDNRFDFHRATDEKLTLHDSARSICGGAAHDLNEILPEGREKSLAITKLEEAMFWANAALARS